MQPRLTAAFVVTTVALGLGELASAVMIKVENYPDAQPLLAVLFGLLFFVGAWLVVRGRTVVAAVLVGLLCLVEVMGFPGWTRHRVLDWVFQVGYATVSLVGLVLAVAVLAAHRRRPAIRV